MGVRCSVSVEYLFLPLSFCASREILKLDLLQLRATLTWPTDFHALRYRFTLQFHNSITAK